MLIEMSQYWLNGQRFFFLIGHLDSDIEVSIAPSTVPPRVVQAPPPLAGAPPSYSALMRLDGNDQMRLCNNRRPGIGIQPSPPFIAPQPPPSYAEVQGFQMDRPYIVASGKFLKTN